MQQTSIKGVQDLVWLVGNGDLQRIVQETEILTYDQMVYAQTRICPRKWDTQNSLEF